MEIELIQEEKFHKQYGIIYTPDDIKDCIEREAEQLKPEVNAKGFRPGKVPTDYIIRMYGEKLRIQAMNNKVTGDISALVKENDYDLAVSPVYKFREREETGDANFYLEVDLYLNPEVPERDWKAFDLETYKPNDAAFQEILDKNLMMFQIMTADFEEVTEGGSQENDRVKFKLEVAINEEEAPGLGNDIQAILGHEQVPSEIEKELFGLNSGDVKTVEHDYAEDDEPFYPGLAGNKATFKISVEAVQRPIITELDDEKMQKLGFRDSEHLIEVLENNTKSTLDRMAQAHTRNHVMEYLGEVNNDIEVPEFVVDQEAHQIAFNEASGLGNVDAMAEVTSGRLNVEVSDLHREVALRNLRIGLFIRNFAKTNNITVEDAEVKREMENHLNELTRLNSVRPNDKDANYREFITRIRALVLENKVVEAVVERVNIKETILPKDEFFDKVKVA